MPSPFPGMDTYIENPRIFPDFHDAFVSTLREALMQGLPSPYFAALGRRAWVEVSDRYIGPDVAVFRSERRPANRGTTAVAEPEVAEPVVVHVPHDERVEPFIEIISGRGPDRRVVTIIELLSPSNKTHGEHGRDLYLRKHRELLWSKTHLLEIDLLRAGVHTTAVPHPRLERKVSRYDYHACLKRFDNVEDFFIYPILLSRALPTVRFPLLPGDGDVSVNLQTVFDRTWDAGPYSREIDYLTDSIEPPLRPEDVGMIRDCVLARFGTTAGSAAIGE